jgi:hypothetical protein
MNLETTSNGSQQEAKYKVKAHYKNRMADITKLWKLYQQDCEANDDDLGNWNEYGLAFDYVPKGTFDNQRRGYFRYQISWGGPSEEFRFFVDETLNITTCQFWFLDWFDGAFIRVTGKNLDTWREIWDDFQSCDLLRTKIEDSKL